MVVILGPGTGESVSAGPIYPRKIYLVAGSANATATIKANGVAMYPMAALAGSMASLIQSGQEMQFGVQPLPGPVTADVAGTGAQLVIEY